jgi:hypothetical protein
MDVERFRDKYLIAANQPAKAKAAKTLAPWPGEKRAGGSETAAEAYRTWVQEQARKSGLQTPQVAKVDADTLLTELESENREHSETQSSELELSMTKKKSAALFVSKYRSSSADVDRAASGVEVGLRFFKQHHIFFILGTVTFTVLTVVCKLLFIFQERKIKRLDQGHFHPKLEVPGLTCPGRESNPGTLE